MGSLIGGLVGGVLGGHKTNNTSGSQNETGSYSNTGTSSQSGQQTSTGQTSAQQTQTTTPNLPDWYKSFLAGMPAQFAGLQQQLQQQATKPLYGAPQQAQFEQQMNQLYGQAGKDVTSQLAARGALNSGRAAQVQTGLDIGKAGQIGGYLAQVPLLNAQNQQAVQGQLLQNQGQMAGWNPTGAFGSTTTGSSVQNTLNNLISALSGNTSQTGTSQQTGTSKSNQSGGSGLLGKL